MTPNLIWSAASITNTLLNDTSSKKFKEKAIILSLKHFFSFFHIEELSTLITEHNLNFAFLGITESSSKLQRNRISSIQLSGYKIEYIAAKYSNGGTLLSIKKG